MGGFHTFHTFHTSFLPRTHTGRRTGAGAWAHARVTHSTYGRCGSMEEVRQRKAVLELVRRAMPRVAEMVEARRKTLGDEHVTRCQQRGMAGEPGWFYAREGMLAIGRIWPAAIEAEQAAMPQGIDVAGTAFVVLRPKEGAGDGA